ncbi:DUF2169 domain-containing protein [Mitsuaria sp. GD03876]|uniref:DUF2169 family type VI secretion system accessory protein n=1 Tax=Mitsuaria sp. GD03876 TaxID=2975399 RepID=UPI00244C99B6|nr:DUF2169 domain-containing protein [Mitsuaria sp. GD03876]MDH0868138.1 DUF2169 domain-containing protein [Mitsuaria sp. GD03876]
MQLQIGSKQVAADISVAVDVSGREHLVVVAKSTWSLPEAGQRPRPLPPQPLVVTDEYYGEPGESAMRYGSDMVRFKPRCDVILDACAYSADGRPVTELLAGFELGPLRKQLRVDGARRWQRVAQDKPEFKLSEPEPFTRVPLHFGFAFGGSRWYAQGQDRLCEAHLHNPAGAGFAGQRTVEQMHLQPAHQLEHPQQPVRQPGDPVAPQALSAIGRHWLPRRQHAGTYDEDWQRDVFPLLPLDFDEQFHQVAPVDQQMPYPRGGEPVRLSHLLPGRPDVRFAMPRLSDLGVRIQRDNDALQELDVAADTVFLELEHGRFSVVWRASVPIRRHIREIKAVLVAPRSSLAWMQQTGPNAGCFSCNEAGEPAPIEEAL